MKKSRNSNVAKTIRFSDELHDETNELIKKGKAANIISDTNLRVPID